VTASRYDISPYRFDRGIVFRGGKTVAHKLELSYV